VPSGRRSAVAIAGLSAILIVALVGPAVTAATPPPGLKAFMWAVGQVESGGRYTARNPSSGAYGKYQIMPSNWPAWAEQYLGNRNAPQSPANQEKVAAGKMTSLYRSLGSWRRVAYWWLTGSKKSSDWSAYATRYVNKVMRLYQQAGGANFHGDGAAHTAKRYSEATKLATYHGTWKTARHGGYAGDAVRYATQAGAKVSFTFTGKSIRWHGPLGPTRGKAKVFVDGKYVRTVDLYRRSFDAQARLFQRTWTKKATHTLTIVVVGTKGRPMVAVDEFVVVP
jgi:hypothetical protein